MNDWAGLQFWGDSLYFCCCICILGMALLGFWLTVWWVFISSALRDCGRSRFILQKSPSLAIFKMDTMSSGEDWLYAWYRPVLLMGICWPNIIRFRETSFCTLEALGLAPQSHIRPQKSTNGPWEKLGLHLMTLIYNVLSSPTTAIKSFASFSLSWKWSFIWVKMDLQPRAL